MQGSLSLRGGVLYVARHAQASFVRPYDLDGRPLARGFALRDENGDALVAGGIEVDSDRQVWVADPQHGCVRAFNLFGAQTARIAGLERGRDDRRGVLRRVLDVALSESDEARQVWVASGGSRRHAVQQFSESGACLDSLRPLGDPLARFEDVQRIAVSGRFLYVCEFGAGRVQVFRDGEHLFWFRPLDARGSSVAPTAIAPLPDGRMVVAGGLEDARLLLFDGSGRLMRELARTGRDAADVRFPGDVVVESSPDGGSARIALIDCDGERVQVFNLEGACHGQLAELPGHAVGESE